MKIALKLHSLNILNSKRFKLLFNLQGLPKTQLASVLVEQLSQDIKHKKKYDAFLSYLKMENSHVYYEIVHHRKLLLSC